MKNTNSTYRNISLGLAATGLLFSTGLAVAQQDTEEILVSASSEFSELVAKADKNLTTDTVELNQRVSFADLDLKSPGDVTELNARIEAVAIQSCQRLSDMFPLDKSDPMELHKCEERAIASTEKQLAKAIAAAN